MVNSEGELCEEQIAMKSFDEGLDNQHYQHWILRHGPPAYVHLDNGSNFRSSQFQEFLL